jgi:hypothetical protein
MKIDVAWTSDKATRRHIQEDRNLKKRWPLIYLMMGFQLFRSYGFLKRGGWES